MALYRAVQILEYPAISEIEGDYLPGYKVECLVFLPPTMYVLAVVADEIDLESSRYGLYLLRDSAFSSFLPSSFCILDYFILYGDSFLFVYFASIDAFSFCG